MNDKIDEMLNDWNCSDTIIQEMELKPENSGCGFSYASKCGTVHNNGNLSLRMRIVGTRHKEVYDYCMNVDYIPVDKLQKFIYDIYYQLCHSIMISEHRTVKRFSLAKEKLDLLFNNY